MIQIRRQPISGGGWVSTHEDITEFNAPRTLDKRALSLQALIDWVPDYLWVKDTESRFVVANKALAVDSGCAKTSDMIGLTDFDLHARSRAGISRDRAEYHPQRATDDRQGGTRCRSVWREEVAFVDESAGAQ